MQELKLSSYEQIFRATNHLFWTAIQLIAPTKRDSPLFKSLFRGMSRTRLRTIATAQQNTSEFQHTKKPKPLQRQASTV